VRCRRPWLAGIDERTHGLAQILDIVVQSRVFLAQRRLEYFDGVVHQRTVIQRKANPILNLMRAKPRRR
jgi:hypothetical protein